MRRHLEQHLLFVGLLGLCLVTLTGCHTTRVTHHRPWPVYTLTAENQWLLNPPNQERFDASALLIRTNGDLLTLSDRGAALYRMVPATQPGQANLVSFPACFSESELASVHPEKTRLDCEGLAQDEQGRIYICEESNRWILRCDPATGQTEILPVSWLPVKRYFSSDLNASFEGVAVGNGKLYVANERSEPLIIEVDLKTLKIRDSYTVRPQTSSLLGILHYSDLSWYGGHLYVLCRHHRVILEIDPISHEVLAEYSYRRVEDGLGYKTAYPTGIMEGLAVDGKAFWLVTDNNGLGRSVAPNDLRPTLVKCLRPEK